MVFFCFLIWGLFFHFIAFGLSLSGVGYHGFFFLFFYLFLHLPFYSLWFRSVGLRLLCFFFGFLICAFFLVFIAFGLISSGLGYDGYFRFFDLGLLFPFFCLWFKFVGCRLLLISFVF